MSLNRLDVATEPLATAADLVVRSVHATLTYYAFPDIHSRRSEPTIRSSRSCLIRRLTLVSSFPYSSSASTLLQLSSLHRRICLVDQTIHEYASPLSNPGRTNRSRRLIKCAKDSGHYLSSRCQSCLNLAAARLRYIAGSAWSTKRYMSSVPSIKPRSYKTGAVA